uniref:Uncharacterized protein isoform X1 n=3 Tax=Nicotiana tabacum TaxID=4097 RepID=A0A1S4BCG5_TOBAC|nr:PREDICTED: uncharacterized protein LOC107806794 isoform X1 [Nicotiana tabacum]
MKSVTLLFIGIPGGKWIMNQEGRSSKNKKLTKFIAAGSLASLQNLKVSSLKTNRVIKAPRSLPLHSTSTSAQAVHEQVQQMPLNSTPSVSQAVREQLQHSTSAGGSLPLHSTSAPAQIVHEQEKQMPLNSTSLASQLVRKQWQQLPLDSTPRTSQTVQEQVEDSSNHETNEQSEEQGPSAEKRKRGKTLMQSVHGRKDRKQIVLNENNQLIGPTDDDVNELGNFLGTLARNATICPLNVFDWRKLEIKEDMWKYVKKMKETNTENRKKLRYPHTAGKKRFARICEAEMDRIQSTQEAEDGSQSVDMFASVMGPEHPGRLRLYGRGVTKTSLKRKVGDIGTSSSSTDEMLQQKMVEMEERMQQRMQEKFNAQKDAMELQVAVNIISQFKRLNPDL